MLISLFRKHIIPFNINIFAENINIFDNFCITITRKNIISIYIDIFYDGKSLMMHGNWECIFYIYVYNPQTGPEEKTMRSIGGPATLG